MTIEALNGFQLLRSFLDYPFNQKQEFSGAKADNMMCKFRSNNSNHPKKKKKTISSEKKKKGHEDRNSHQVR